MLRPEDAPKKRKRARGRKRKAGEAGVAPGEIGDTGDEANHQE